MLLDRIFNLGYSIEIFKEKNGDYLLFVWKNAHLEGQDLVCSTCEKTVTSAIRKTIHYLETGKR